jgi:photosystem II stability/assembly factor-like uncharacterized protein
MVAVNFYSEKSKKFLRRPRLGLLKDGTGKVAIETITAILLVVALVGLMGTYFWTSYRSEKGQLSSIETNVLSCHDDILGIHRGTGGQAWAVGKNGVILHTKDGGREWKLESSGTTQTLCAVSFAHKTAEGGGPIQEVGFAVGASGTILSTQDGGLSWVKQGSGVKDNLLGVQALDKTTAYTVGAFGTFLSTFDGGATWTKYKFSWEKFIPRVIEEQGGLVEPNLNAVCFVTPAIGWVAGEFGLILHTRDGGRTWTSQRNGGKLGQLFDVKFRDERTGWAVGQRGGFIWTQDGGQHWLPVKRNSDRDLFAVSVEGQNILVVGDRTLVASKDGGATWTEDKAAADGFVLTGVAQMAGSSSYTILTGQSGVMLIKDEKKVEKCLFPRY